MLDYMIDRFKHRRVPFLDQAGPTKIVGAEPGQNRIGLGHSSSEILDQIGARRSTTRGKFRCAIPFYVLFADSSDYPLSDVPGKVQQEITDAVG